MTDLLEYPSYKKTRRHTRLNQYVTLFVMKLMVSSFDHLFMRLLQFSIALEPLASCRCEEWTTKGLVSSPLSNSTPTDFLHFPTQPTLIQVTGFTKLPLDPQKSFTQLVFYIRSVFFTYAVVLPKTREHILMCKIVGVPL